MRTNFCLVIILAAGLSACAGSQHPLAYGLPDSVESDGKLFELTYRRQGHAACLYYQEVRYLRGDQPPRSSSSRAVGQRQKICAENFDHAFDIFNEQTARGNSRTR